MTRQGLGINRILPDAVAGWTAPATNDDGVEIVDLASGRKLADLKLDDAPALALAGSADGSQVAIGDAEGFLRAVSSADWSTRTLFRAAERGPIRGLADDASGTRPASVGLGFRVDVRPLDDRVPQIAAAADRRAAPSQLPPADCRAPLP